MKQYQIWMLSLLMIVALLLSKTKSLKGEMQYFWQSPAGISVAKTGTTLSGFNRLGLQAGPIYKRGNHRFATGIQVNYIDPARYRTEIGYEWYEYTPLLSWKSRHLDPYPFKSPAPPDDNNQISLKLQPGVYGSYIFHFLNENPYDFSLFTFFRFQYQLDAGNMQSIILKSGHTYSSPMNSPIVYEYEGFFHVFGNFIGLGIEYHPFDQWGIQFSTGTGIGISRIYTDHENKEEIEELLNRTFPYSQFDLGVQYRFRN